MAHRTALTQVTLEAGSSHSEAGRGMKSLMEITGGNVFSEEWPARHNQEIWGSAPGGVYEGLTRLPFAHRQCAKRQR
jgi:hypothetical protein